MRKYFLTYLFASLFLMLPGTDSSAAVNPNFYIYICFGQSNMEGNAKPEEIDMTGIDNRFRLLATCDFPDLQRTTGHWYAAKPPLVNPAGGLGPTDYFGRMMCEALPKEVRIGVIPVAMGGSPIEMFDKDLYQQKMAENPNDWWAILARDHYAGNPYGRIIEMAKIAQKVGVIKGILLHQGCTNCGDPNWPGMVKKIYEDMLADLNLGTDSVPLFVGETLRQDQGGTCYGHNTQVARMPSFVKNSYVISSEGCPGNGNDPWHFNALGYRMMGSRYAAEALYTLGEHYPYFSFHQFDFRMGTNCSYDESSRTLTSTGAGVAMWDYSRTADWSSYKYLVLKLKEPQTAKAVVWLYKRSGTSTTVAYRDTINDHTTVAIDLHNLRNGNSVMNPSMVGRMAFRCMQAGTVVFDDVFLSNDEQYGQYLTAVSDVVADDAFFHAPLYSLDGRLAGSRAPKSGVYIRNGKKIYIKE